MESPLERRAPNGIFYRVGGDGPPLLLLHGLLVSGAMFDPLVELICDRFRICVPDLRGHGKSGGLAGPYDVAALASDLPAVLDDAGIERCTVLGYSHGGAVAQAFAHAHPASVGRLILACTYAHNTETLREKIEARIFVALLYVVSPAMLAKLIFRSRPQKPDGPAELAPELLPWLRSLVAANRGAQMRGAVRGLLTFDSRPWLGDIEAPALVVAAAMDSAVPRHHYETLVNGIPNAAGKIVARADHTLIWTNTGELAGIVVATA